MVFMKLDSSALGFAHIFPPGRAEDGSVLVFPSWGSGWGCALSARLRMLQPLLQELEWFKPPPCCKWDVKHGKGTKEQQQ